MQRIWKRGVAAAVLLGLAGPAHATLGGDVASVAANEQHLQAVRQVVQLPSGERHELRVAADTRIHEYLTPGGAVYAVTWRGPRMPDLRELLGPYFAQMSHTRRYGGHHRATRRAGDLIVESSGRRRAFSGRAWVPSLVPAGVQIDSIE